MENIKAFDQYLHSIIECPSKYIDLKQDTCKRVQKLLATFLFSGFGSLCLRSCSPSLSVCLAMSSSLSMGINGLFGMHCSDHNYKLLHTQNQCNSFYFNTWRYSLIRKCITTFQLFASGFSHWKADKKYYLICSAHRRVLLSELNTRNVWLPPVRVRYSLERVEAIR